MSCANMVILYNTHAQLLSLLNHNHLFLTTDDFALMELDDEVPADLANHIVLINNVSNIVIINYPYFP
jgi:hypothetical protein